ncbi:GPW/gp25 family protein [Streptomyces sp. NPDC050504]|uniref:GPW/gp25 family protein n=1 Tax=Streptomyces sp. NPDC050504 TaxID=3365618 RepID=UPI0037913A58
MTVTGFGFPFRVNRSGTIAPDQDEGAELRGKIVQVLLTAPGERINQPEFGCGLLNLVFDPANAVMATAVEFSVGQALTRWLGRELAVAAVDVRAHEETLTVEVGYVRRRDLTRQAVRVHFK